MTTKRSKKKTSFTHAAGAALLATAMLAGAAPAWAGEAATKCQAGKNAAGSAYFSCLAKAEKAFVAKGDMVKYDETVAKCQTKLQATWDKLEATAVAAGDPCPAQGDVAAVKNLLDGCAGGVAEGASGGTPPPSPLVCQANLQTSDQSLNTCDEERISLLQSCSCPLSPLLKTGQTTSYGAGSDGAQGRGMSRSFADNGDGTITDNATGLMWEKKSDDGSIHDQDNTYTWGAGVEGESTNETMNGTMVTTFLANLNSGGGFAGYTDWRIPNTMELESLRNFQVSHPSVYTEFNDSCTDGCTVTTCSCTSSNAHWTSTTQKGDTLAAWYVSFIVGQKSWIPKQSNLHVRAVRAGL